MPPEWDQAAARLQAMNRESEFLNGALYSEEEARRAAVHTREDVTLLVSYLSTLNRQAAAITTSLRVVIALLTVLAAAQIAFVWLLLR